MLLAPTGALVLMMVHYISAVATFSDFEHLCLSILLQVSLYVAFKNSINAIDVIGYLGIFWGYFGDIFGIFLEYFWDILGIFLVYFGDILEIFWGYFGDILGIF